MNVYICVYVCVCLDVGSISDKVQRQTVYSQERFHNAMAIAGSEFVAKIRYFTDVWWPVKMLADDTNEGPVEVSVDFTVTTKL